MENLSFQGRSTRTPSVKVLHKVLLNHALWHSGHFGHCPPVSKLILECSIKLSLYHVNKFWIWFCINKFGRLARFHVSHFKLFFYKKDCQQAVSFKSNSSWETCRTLNIQPDVFIVGYARNSQCTINTFR